MYFEMKYCNLVSNGIRCFGSDQGLEIGREIFMGEKFVGWLKIELQWKKKCQYLHECCLFAVCSSFGCGIYSVEFEKWVLDD